MLLFHDWAFYYAKCDAFECTILSKSKNVAHAQGTNTSQLKIITPGFRYNFNTNILGILDGHDVAEGSPRCGIPACNTHLIKATRRGHGMATTKWRHNAKL